MRVMMKRKVDNGEVLLLPRQVYDLPDEYAKRLLFAGVAEPVTVRVERGGTLAEAAIAPAPERRKASR